MDKKRCRQDSDSDESPETKRLRANILDILDDDVIDSLFSGETDPDVTPDPDVQDLVTVMKSFEEEIAVPPSATASVSDSGESQPDLGYLFEATDDELGLPPTFSGDGEIGNFSSDNFDQLLFEVPEETPNPNPNTGSCVGDGLGQLWGFDDEVQGFDLYGAFGEMERKESEESVVYEGLFDYPNDVIDEQSMFSWRQTETLPAVQ